MTSLAANLRRDRTLAVSPTAALLVGTFLLAVVIYFAGLTQNLPYFAEVDEPTRVVRAVDMVMNWDPNPHWFGHPASTVFYPLALLIYIYNAVALGGSFFHRNPELARIFQADLTPFYVLGRLITIAYGLASLPLLYAVGRRIFSPRVGLGAVWLSLTFTIVLSNAQVVRSDSAALFFSLLSLWLCLRFHNRPTMLNRVWCALAIGLAVSSRYFMVAYALPLAVAELALLWQCRQRGQPLGRAFLRACVSPLAALAGFALTTPFLFLDFGTAMESISVEARTSQVGFDGLSPAGNFLWYVTRAIPETTSSLYLILAVGVVVVAVRYRRLLPALLAGFIIAYVAGISIHPLHQQRWLVQIIPLIGLLAAAGVAFFSSVLCKMLKLKGAKATALLATLVVAILAVPAYDMVLFEIRQVTPSTRVQAMRWMGENLPSGSRVLEDVYSADVLPPSLKREGVYMIGQAATTLAEFRQRDIDYIVVNDEIYTRFFSEPQRYKKEVALYTEIFTKLPMIRQFEPSPVRPGVVPHANVSPGHPGTGGGPVIRIYQLRGH